MTITTDRRAAITWNALLRWAGLADLVAIGAMAIAFRDREAAALAGLILAAIVFLRIRHGVASMVILGILSLDVLGFMAPAALKNIVGKQGYVAALVPASLAVISLTGVIAATGSIARRKAPASSPHAAGLVLQVVIAAFVLAAGATVVQQRGAGAHAARPGDIVVEVHDLSYAPSTITARAGQGVAVRNTDLFWHTFTVEGTTIDLGLATHATERAAIALAPGNYTYFCRVPGHRQAGMKGTLVVR